MIPKTKDKLEKEYKKCEKSFVKIDNRLFKEYMELSYEDLESARNEKNARWTVTKAYQSLFLMCNSILVRKKGFYSKDHNCLILALVHDNLISKELLERIHELLKNKDKLFNEFNPEDSFFEEISLIRIERNNRLYLPITLRTTKKKSDEIVGEVRELIKILGEIQ